MKRIQLISLMILLVASVLMGACSQGAVAVGSQEETPAASHGGPVSDYVSLTDNLRAAGATVESAGNLSESLFGPEAQVIKVNGQDVQVFEFASKAEAEDAAVTVSADGTSTGTTMITWIATPHFYQSGKLIALYVGDDSGVISLLEEVFGPQFAGG
jgi:hypothetical protein